MSYNFINWCIFQTVSIFLKNYIWICVTCAFFKHAKRPRLLSIFAELKKLIVQIVTSLSGTYIRHQQYNNAVTVLLFDWWRQNAISYFTLKIIVTLFLSGKLHSRERGTSLPLFNFEMTSSSNKRTRKKNNTTVKSLKDGHGIKRTAL